jgi:hypothetical protein
MIVNDTSTELSGFLRAVAPGVGTFIIVMGVFGGIGAIIYAVATMIKKKIN